MARSAGGGMPYMEKLMTLEEVVEYLRLSNDSAINGDSVRKMSTN